MGHVMDRGTQIEISNMADAVENMATQQFANDRSCNAPFETTICYGDTHPDRIRLVCEGLRLSLCEVYAASRVHVSIEDSGYSVRIDRT
jgi:hypothetical protein